MTQSQHSQAAREALTDAIIDAKIRKNLTFLNTVIQHGDWERLRRHPPCVMPDPQGEAHLIELALQRVRDWSARRAETPAPLAAAQG